MGIYNANEKGTVFICNVCEREFVPLLLSGVCCGVDNKREKVIVYTEEQQAILDKIKAIRNKPFINRHDVEETANLEREFMALKSV